MKILSVLITPLIVLCLMAAAPGARAQEAVLDVPAVTDTPLLAAPSSPTSIKQYSQQFYKRCKTTPSEYLSDQENDEYCVCLSAQMYRKTLTDAERAFLATGKGVTMDPKRATTEFYGQCIGVPGRAATYHHCTHTPDIFKYVKGEDELKLMCECVNNQLAAYWDQEAPAFIEMTLRSRHADRLKGDMITALMKGRDFPVRYANERSFCVRKYGRRD